MNPLLKEKLQESLSAVAPITVIVLALSVLLVPMSAGTVLLFLLGAMMLVVGMALFQLGADMAMTPLGKGIGAHMTQSRRVWLLVLLGFAMGAIITIAEPDLLVLAEQVPSIPNRVLIFTVAAGVGIFVALAILRILFGISLSTLLIILYVALIGLSFLIPPDFLAVAFDSGGVTTGPITVPFIMALGVGLAAVRGDRHAADDSFGLVALASVGPILAVMVLGCFFRPTGAAYSGGDLADVATTRDAVLVFARQLPRYGQEVLVSLAPIAGVFLLFQLLTKRFHHTQLRRMIVGFIYTILGLVLFLCGVNVGFSPVGAQLGSDLAGSAWKWFLVPIGMLIGYFIVKAEPAIQVLNKQVQAVTNGTISAGQMNACLSIGVAISVGLAMLRVLTGISLYWIVIPGYLIALVLSRLVPPMFVGIAFDSGGVASGPMTTTFLLPLSIGACQAAGGNLMTDAFGVVALVALTPLIAVQIMGLQYRIKMAAIEKTAAVTAAEVPGGDDIVDLDEDAAGSGSSESAGADEIIDF
ncbi:MAG: DUF1538 domain-containing protein [Oscillospiraceae bacterium]|nr:DUF1538 domain-containing protein [Oscillospiraceae bacterium]